VLLAVAADPTRRVADISAEVGITTRQALNILRDLEEADYLRRRRDGRRTQYTLNPEKPFRHPHNSAHRVAELLAIFEGDSPP